MTLAWNSQGTYASRSGAALIEASLVMAMLCLALFGALQISRLYAAREVLDYAAMNGARARTVGFNSFMVHKVVRVSAIPNAGPPTMPDIPMAADTALDWMGGRPGDLWDASLHVRAPVSPRTFVEQQRIPFFLAAPDYGYLNAILDYRDWNTIFHNADQPSANEIRVTVRQNLPFTFPMSRAFVAGDSVTIEAGDAAGARMAEHSSLYLE